MILYIYLFILIQENVSNKWTEDGCEDNTKFFKLKRFKYKTFST